MLLKEPWTLAKSIQCLLEAPHLAWLTITGWWDDVHSCICRERCVEKSSAYISEEHLPRAQ
eukprot:4236524-Heterocapsa_arctica.AAC.1